MRVVALLLVLAQTATAGGPCFRAVRKFVPVQKVIVKKQFVPQVVNNYYSPPVALQSYAQLSYQQDQLALQQASFSQRRTNELLAGIYERQQQFSSYQQPQYQQNYAPPQQQYAPQQNYASQQAPCPNCAHPQQQCPGGQCNGMTPNGGDPRTPPPSPPFSSQQRSVLDQNCLRCHNSQKSNGGMNFEDPSRLSPEEKSRAVEAMESGEMPPPEEGPPLSPRDQARARFEMLTDDQVSMFLQATQPQGDF